MSTDSDVFVAFNVDLPTQIKLARTEKNLRQNDVAYLASQHLHQNEMLNIVVTARDVSSLERLIRIDGRKKRAILRVLGLEVENGNSTTDHHHC